MISDRRLALAPWEVGAFVVAVVLGRWLALEAAVPEASAWVDLRYAQNLAAGRGFVFTPGAPWEPTAGASAPGFAGLLALLRDSWGGSLEAARWLSLFADAITAGALALLLGARPLAARLCLTLFALLPVFVLQPSRADSGSLALCLAVCAAAALRVGRPGLAGGWAGLGTLLRPELGLLAPCLALFAKGKGQARIVLPTVASALLFLLWIRRGFEPPLWIAPLTRMELADAGVLERWSALALSAMGAGSAGGLALGEGGASGWGLLLAPPALYGFYRAMQVRERSLLSLVAAAVAVVLAGTFSALEPGDGLLHVARGAWIACAGLGGAGLWRHRPAGRRALAPMALIGAGLLGVWWPPPPSSLPQQDELLAWAQRTRAQNKTLYVPGGAALAYLADVRVLGCDGGGLPLGRGEQQRRDALRHLKPDYLLLEVSRDGLGFVYGDEELARGYYPVGRFSRTGKETRNPSLAELPARAAGELLLMRRGEFGQR